MDWAKHHHWGIILAAGKGARLQKYIKSIYGYERPKQFCSIIGTRSMLRHTIDRVKPFFLQKKILTVIIRDYLAYIREEMNGQPAENIVVQPHSKETAPGILLPLLKIYSQDPEANVGIFPSDQFILEEDLFRDYMGSAFEFTDEHPGKIVVMGFSANSPETEYGWIEHGDEVKWDGGAPFYRVNKFWEKPDVKLARRLYAGSCMWNTMVMVGKASAFLERFRILLPEVYEQFVTQNYYNGHFDDEIMLNNIYSKLPEVNFSDSILKNSVESLCVMPLNGVYWSDWGAENRIKTDIERFRLLKHHVPLINYITELPQVQAEVS